MNKRLCVLWVFSVLASLSFLHAQTRPNVVREGGQWDFYHIDGYPSALGVTSFYTLGTDTAIGAQTYKKVLCREKVDTAEEKSCPWGLREDEKRLYLYDYTTQKEHVLCDFSLRPGDTLATNWPWYPPVFVVEKVGDTILPGRNTPLRYLAVRDKHRHQSDLWVEKIGPLHYGIHWGYLWMAGGVINELLCYSENGNMLYQNPVYKTCYIHYDTGTFRGKIVSVPAPFYADTYTEGKSTFGLKVDTVIYTLASIYTKSEYFTFSGKKYATGDSVEVSGKIYNIVDDAYEEFLMLSVQSIRKQDDYLEDGKVWSMLSVSGPERWTYTVSVFGEVERCGHIWKHSRTDEQEFLLLRQEDKKIWAMCPYDNVGMDTVPFLMFDFGLKKGDTAHLYVDTVHHRDDVWIVEDVFDSVFEYGQESKHCQRVYFMKYPEIEDIWVEGIGSLANGLTYSPIGFLRGPSELICVQKATGDIVYHNKKYSYCYIDDTIVSETYTGTLISMPNPATEIPVMPGLVMGLQCNGKQYVLSKIGWFWDGDYIKIGGVFYEEGDSVEIKGVLSTHIDLLNRTYYELEIDTIRKIEKTVDTTVDTTGNRTLREIGNIRYDAVHQTLVIEGDVKIDRLEVMDVRGRCVLHVDNPTGSVSVAHLPRGLYLYRLTAPATTQSGKFVR